MKKPHRVKIKRRNNRRSSIRTNLIGIITLAAILSGVLLYLTNERTNEQVFVSYCGDYGFYGKSLTLMKDGAFNFSYHGCSQSNGNISGKWEIEDNTLVLTHDDPYNILDSIYQIVGNQLLSDNKRDKGFIICEEYISPLDELVIE